VEHFKYGRYAVWYSSRSDFCQRRHVVFSCSCVLEALVLSVRFWRILMTMALICVFSILTFVKKNVILHFNIKYMYRVVLALVLK
jgi:hypothetical protein